MTGIEDDTRQRPGGDDVLVRRGNGERCVLSSLTGKRAVIVIGKTMDDLGESFELVEPTDTDPALVVGIHRLEPHDHEAAAEIVFADDHAMPELLESPSMPVAYVVRGVTPLGPAAIGARQIELLLADVGAPRPRRSSGAIELGDITT